jgi:hypothetical protein
MTTSEAKRRAFEFSTLLTTRFFWLPEKKNDETMSLFASLFAAVVVLVVIEQAGAVCNPTKARVGGICRCVGDRKTGPAPELVVGEFVRRVTPCGFRDEDSDKKRQSEDRYLWSPANLRCSHVTLLATALVVALVAISLMPNAN